MRRLLEGLQRLLRCFSDCRWGWIASLFLTDKGDYFRLGLEAVCMAVALDINDASHIPYLSVSCDFLK